jgi:hypothetical protein
MKETQPFYKNHQEYPKGKGIKIKIDKEMIVKVGRNE